MNKAIITGMQNPNSEGVTLIFSEPTRLKGSNGLRTKEWWVSWDAIGRAMFEDYTAETGVAERDELRAASV